MTFAKAGSLQSALNGKSQVNAPIEPSFFSSYRKVAAEYTAGTDSNFDPFELAIE